MNDTTWQYLAAQVVIRGAGAWAPYRRRGPELEAYTVAFRDPVGSQAFIDALADADAGIRPITDRDELAYSIEEHCEVVDCVGHEVIRLTDLEKTALELAIRGRGEKYSRETLVN